MCGQLMFLKYVTKGTLRHLIQLKKAGTSHSASVTSEYVKDKQLSDQQLSVQDFTDAEESLVAYVQQKAFRVEGNALRAGQAARRSSRLYKLDLILNDGILRVGGRLNKLAMPEDFKQPKQKMADLPLIRKTPDLFHSHWLGLFWAHRSQDWS